MQNSAFSFAVTTPTTFPKIVVGAKIRAIWHDARARESALDAAARYGVPQVLRDLLDDLLAGIFTAKFKLPREFGMPDAKLLSMR